MLLHMDKHRAQSILTAAPTGMCPRYQPITPQPMISTTLVLCTMCSPHHTNINLPAHAHSTHMDPVR